jgi:hypothetical protein
MSDTDAAASEDEEQRIQTDPVFIPFEIAAKTLRDSNGELCWRYMGLGRGWHAWFNAETGCYEVAVSGNVPEPTDDGLIVRVEVKEYWAMGRLNFEDLYPDRWHGRLETVPFEESPFPSLERDPDDPPRRVPNGE